MCFNISIFNHLQKAYALLKRRNDQRFLDSKALIDSQALISVRYRKNLIVIYGAWFTFLPNTMRENAHGETDPR